MPTDPWWDIALDPDDRAADNRLHADGAPLVGGVDADGRPDLDYAGYLRLDLLLGAQRPASSVPDERVFVVVHQLCELVFKQMVFDLAVVAGTLERAAAADDAQALALAEGRVDDPDSATAAFWRPAITASNRLRHAARRILPPVMELMSANDEDDVLFSRVEFGLFRAHLTPSSGFQTAQLRLIQRALAKGPLLDLRVFPGAAYQSGSQAGGAAQSPCGHVALADPTVLRGGAETATPPSSHPATLATRLDGAAHALLARLADLAPESAPPAGGPPRPIDAADVDRAVDRFRATLGPDAEGGAVADFRDDLERAAAAENERRAGLGPARAGARALVETAPRSALAHVLARVVALDDALHAPADSFLTVHRRTVRRHVEDGSGTGGGGMPYLVTSQRYLLPLFPALVGFRGIEG
ncbi:tryptophan 2,3-dioxygenase family protein [Rubrivirga litoralis]|uniref:Tryptophan 2,3-dioxygenase family protein n=1 Tax=Rubrivirga litoralis TaxID=3075598 RepID=A0ABU3BMX6_9BACT|nr:tryptophan 2,3-dioxygenase family protein [Rubrivirga sp. F394]MDT0630613.1 tryptophan 2,3-dioxygenase family protein [Rubrivirga sp. F394]